MVGGERTHDNTRRKSRLHKERPSTPFWLWGRGANPPSICTLNEWFSQFSKPWITHFNRALCSQWLPFSYKSVVHGNCSFLCWLVGFWEFFSTHLQIGLHFGIWALLLYTHKYCIKLADAFIKEFSFLTCPLLWQYICKSTSMWPVSESNFGPCF